MNKHALVIGVGPGLGLALVRKLGDEGYKVSMLGRTREKLADYKNQLVKEGISTAYYVADAGHFEDLAQAITTAVAQHGNPEILIYNAAVLKQSKPTEYPAHEYLQDFKVNVVGAIQAAQTTVPFMEKLGGGTLLLTGGELAHQPSKEYASLTLGKSGIWALAHLLHQDLHTRNIKVGTVTIGGQIKKHTFFDPDSIAEAFWEMHQAPFTGWEIEMRYAE